MEKLDRQSKLAIAMRTYMDQLCKGLAGIGRPRTIILVAFPARAEPTPLYFSTKVGLDRAKMLRAAAMLLLKEAEAET